MSRPTFSDFKKKALQNREVKEEYEALKTAYELRKKLIALRQEAGLTQEQLAAILHTQKSNISRLENASSTISPKLSTIVQYAHAVGYEVKIEFAKRSYITRPSIRTAFSLPMLAKKHRLRNARHSQACGYLSP